LAAANNLQQRKPVWFIVSQKQPTSFNVLTDFDMF